MNRTMTHMDEVTQRNAAASEELASTAEEMTSQAEALRELMSFFRSENAGTRPEGPAAAWAVPRRRAVSSPAHPALRASGEMAVFAAPGSEP